jgi:hypothetical protein
MGKTGSIKWVQIRGAKAQIRLVRSKDVARKKPGPNQRFKPAHRLMAKPKKISALERWDRIDPRLRRGIPRRKTFIIGAKKETVRK